MGSCRYCAQSTYNVRLPSLLFIFASRSHGVADGPNLLYTKPQPTTLNFLRQYVLRFLFVPPAPSLMSRSTDCGTSVLREGFDAKSMWRSIRAQSVV